MGVTTEVWRGRIGAFLPIIRSLSTRERRSWPSRKLYRTYKRPPEQSKTHQLNLYVLLTLVSLILAAIVSRHHPFDDVRKLKVHQVLLDTFAVHFAVFHYGGNKQPSARTWQESITAAIRMVMFILLLLCGDIESNPGPKEPQTTDTRPKKVHKVERMDTNEKIGISASTLERLWGEVCIRWEDVTMEDYKLTEADGTELSDEFYYQQLESKIPLQLISKSTGTKSNRRTYARVNDRPLTDDLIHEIATNHITHDIVNLGIAMGFKHPRISNYKAENATEPRAESRGTENMIMYWRQGCNDLDQVGAFCKILQEAELNELADDLSNGKIYSSHRVKQTIDLMDLQRQLRKYYAGVLCYVRTIPWKKESDVPINDGFNPPSLFYHKKTSRRKTLNFDPNFSCAKSTFFNDFHFNDGNASKRENVEPLAGSYNDIFRIQQNDVPPGRILINGHPGVGKTTLLYKLAHDWAISADDSELKSVKLLIHLSLKGVSRDAMLGDEIIKQLLPKDTNYTGEQIENCLRQNSDDVVILLDGFDESDFAYQGVDENWTSYGSLYGALKYEEFRSCRIVVTCRPSKVDEFRRKLFNPYAEITINGFVGISIDLFIERYCNERDAEKVKQIIASNLLSLKPLLRVPLFLAMICETVSNDLITNLPFTRTNLMKELCRYLFKTCKHKYMYKKSENEVAQSMHDINLEECLATMGKLAGKQYIINLKGQDVTSRDQEILELCVKVGFISTRDRLSSPEKENSLYFFHGLLRDLCLAQHLVSSRASRVGLPDAQSQSLIDIHDVQISDSVFIFECGLLAGNRCMQSVFNFSSWSGYSIENCTTDFLIQCYFECQSAGYMNINTDIFTKNRTLFMDLNVLNDFAAVKHFLLHNPQSPTTYYFTQFVIKGEEYGIIKEKMNVRDKEIRDCLLGNLDIQTINELMSSCSFLTSITLLNCALSMAGYRTHESSKFNGIQFMSVNACRGKYLVTALLYYIAKQFPNLQSLILTRVYDVDADESDQTLNLCNMVSILFDIGPTCAELKLAEMDGEDLDELRCDIHKSLQELTIFDSVNVMNTRKVFSSLALHFPSLNTLTLSRCQLHFDAWDTEQMAPSSHHSATSNINLIIKECRTSIHLTKLLQIMSIHFPYLSLLRVADSSVDLSNMIEKINLKYLKYVYFKHCLQHVDLSHVIPAFRRILSRLPHLAFIDCSLTFSHDLTNENQEEVFPDIALTNCRIPYQCLSWVSTWCQRLTLHVNENLYVEILYEQVWTKLMLIAHLHSKFRINLNDARDFPGWFPDLHALYFYNSLQPLPLEAFLGVQYPSVQVVLFRECKDEVNMSDTVLMLNSCCPRLEKMFIRYCDVSFGSDPPCVPSDIRHIEFDACRQITFSAVMAFVVSCCPNARELTVGNCELSDDERSLLTRITAAENNVSFSTHLGASNDPMSTESEDSRRIQKSRMKDSKLRFLERVYFTNRSSSLNITDIITTVSYNVQSLVASIIFTKCPIQFTSEVAIPNSPFLNVVTFDFCQLPSKGIFWVAKLCRMVHMYVSDSLMIEIFQNTFLGKKLKVIHLHSDQAINMGDVPHLPVILPDLDVMVFLNVLVDGSENAWKNLQYTSVKSVKFMNCKEVVSIEQAFSAVSVYCQNIERFVVVNGCVSLEQKEERYFPLKELIFDRVTRIRFSDIIDFIIRQCPMMVDLKLQECEFEDEERFEGHLSHAAASKLKAVGFYDFVSTPVNVSNVISVLSSRFRESFALSFTTCKLSYAVGENPSSCHWFESIFFKDCSFPIKCLAWVKSFCKRVDLHVADVFIVLSDVTAVPGKLNATSRSDQPINIHDAPGLPFDRHNDSIYELDFYNVMDYRQHNPEGTIYYYGVKIVRFFECKHTLNIASSLSVFSQCCPKLSKLIVSDTEVSLNGSRVASWMNIAQICISKCNHIDFMDILLFLSFSCPSVEYFSVTASEITLHSSFPQTPNISNSSVKEIYLCDCKVPEDFMLLLNNGYPEFEVSHFLTQNESNSKVAEWSIRRKEANTE